MLYLLTVTMPESAGEAVTAAAQAAGEATTAAAKGALSGVNGTLVMVAYVAVLAFVFYFFAVRPQKKRANALKEVQDSIKVGDEVMTSSGFYGKVVELDGDKVVVEFGSNRGVRIPVNKSEIYGASKDAVKPEK